jgi:biopolymer transport protein ExbD
MSLHLNALEDDDEVFATINTTPLVDVMLVLLIIFLITIPVVRQTVPMSLPKESSTSRITKPENIEVSITQNGQLFWNGQPLANLDVLLLRLKDTAAQTPQPEVHLRGDEKVRFEALNRVMLACQRAGILKISFVTEPPPKG